MSQTPNQDRREQQRQHAPRVPGWMMVGPTWYRVMLWDVSLDGAGMIAPIPLEVGNTINVRIGLGPLRYPRSATIAHCVKINEDQYRVGLQFAQDGADYLPSKHSA